jgi:predicted TIM-barrel fold metal-dependent hydrolase
VKLAEACSNTRFILDHCGNGPVYAADRTQWQRDMDRLARLRNVDCKISGIVVQARATAAKSKCMPFSACRMGEQSWLNPGMPEL